VGKIHRQIIARAEVPAFEANEVGENGSSTAAQAGTRTGQNQTFRAKVVSVDITATEDHPMRYAMLPIFALTVGLFLVSGSAAPADEKATSHDHHAAIHEDCARACNDCQRACDSCTTHCAILLSEGKKEHLKTLQTCQDCATHCAAAAGIVARGGPFADLICKACAEACKRCGDQCEKYKDDAHMKKCADACRKCEKSCRTMLKHLGSK
jgi:hypothetical protein